MNKSGSCVFANKVGQISFDFKYQQYCSVTNSENRKTKALIYKLIFICQNHNTIYAFPGVAITIFFYQISIDQLREITFHILSHINKYPLPKFVNGIKNRIYPK